ncbi:MAG: hypothetical protein ABIJ97_11465 [Bacteroidota bacterium]
MEAVSSILQAMISNEMNEKHEFLISHHEAEKPHRIDVMRDETVFIHKIQIEASVDFWLEFHSATESRLIKRKLLVLSKIDDEHITRHKGSVYFSKSHQFEYKVSYVKLKQVK